MGDPKYKLPGTIPVMTQNLILIQTCRKRILGGGYGNLTEDDNLTSQQLLLPTITYIRGSILVSSLPTQGCNSCWQPPTRLPYKRSRHPLDVGLLPHHTSIITQYSQLPTNTNIAYSAARPNIIFTTHDLHNLITHGQPTTDNTFYLFLEIFCSFFNYTFLTDFFSTSLNAMAGPKLDVISMTTSVQKGGLHSDPT